MGVLKQKEQVISHRTDVIRATLSHFDRAIENNKKLGQKIAVAADNAYTDDILFEEFKLWFDEREDEVFLHQIEHYWNTKDTPPLSVRERDLTGNEAAIEKIKLEANAELKRHFSLTLKKLALAKGLDTQDKLGKYLGVSHEMARVYLSGEHKPQMKTLQKISKKFKVSIESLIGID